MATAHVLPFLGTETRQVWAIHRDTREPYFLAEGAAAEAKAIVTDLRCLAPDCDVSLNAIGGTRRRHHFRHENKGCPGTTGESALHLAAKAMLAAWLNESTPAYSTVAVEERIHPRRPDVVVTDLDGRRTAFEVEYKAWSIPEWEAKQADLDAAGVPVLWLIGHTRLTPVAGTDSTPDAPPRVKVPALVQDIAAAGRPVLAINPLTREIGTLLDHDLGRYDGALPVARFAADSIDECRFDHTLGIVTPTMGLIADAERLATEEAEREREAAERERQEAEAARRSALEAHRRAKAERDAGAGWPDVPDDSALLLPIITVRRPLPLRSWAALRETLIARWGSLPALFGPEEQTESSIEAVTAHWRAALHEDLLFERGSDFAFTLDDALDALSKHNVLVPDRSAARMAIEAWLAGLIPLGLVVEYRYERVRPEQFFTATETAVDGVPTRLRDYTDYLSTLRRRLQALDERTAEGRRKIDFLGLSAKTRPVAFADGIVRWVSRVPWENGQREGLRRHTERLGHGDASAPGADF
ncbi:competence protein CoiA family protein [Nocardioides sp. CER19]|uniref:competence protein CoiA family protein n=1 Tax=Nocardioides sp. CER19 TaxID=3038538 RepID=UPI00244ACB1F|nr:competence protein CoiA family protein [Nocardioides sp. CER19]MDH2413941.1 competence protein CoiA family protein [Nocardioides sp. CER19]